MADRLTERIAARYIAARVKTAGEVRFIKDRGGDKNEWGWGTPGPSEREIGEDFSFDPKNLKPLAKCLRATTAAMGYALSAYDTFTRIKSSSVSPDGNLGGKGYIQKIADMRRAFMNACEALSACSDTLHDEIHAPHWNPAIEEQSPRERDEVKDIMNDADTIRQNPEGWAEDEEAEMDKENEGGGQAKTAASKLSPDKADTLVGWLTSEGYDKATARYEVQNLQQRGLASLDPSVQKDMRRGLSWVKKQAAARRVGGGKWDAATRWFDTEMASLTSEASLREFFTAKIKALLKEVSKKTGVDLHDADAAAEDILGRMFSGAEEMTSWERVADNFWLNAGSHFDTDAITPPGWPPATAQKLVDWLVSEEAYPPTDARWIISTIQKHGYGTLDKKHRDAYKKAVKAVVHDPLLRQWFPGDKQAAHRVAVQYLRGRG